MRLQRPIHFAFSYDEEAGSRGVPHLIKVLPRLCDKPFGAIVGEPSSMQPVRAHKGKAAVRLEVIGRSGHSSRPDLGLNAMHAMAGMVMQIAAYAQSLTGGPLDHDFAPPYSSLQVAVIGGGQSGNIIPDRCTADIELPAIPGLSPSALMEPLKAVSYGTEASLYQQAGIDAIICGPGDIAHAHRPNEYVAISELAACQRTMEDLGARLATSAQAT